MINNSKDVIVYITR